MIRNVLTKFPLFLVLAFIGLASFAATAFAAGAVADDQSSILDLARPVFDAFMGGKYALGAALLVILVVALVKRYAPSGSKFEKFVHSDLGGTLTALLATAATAMSAALVAPGASITLALFKSSFLVGLTAAGGFAVLKNLVWEPLQPYLAKLPAWMQPIFAVVGWIFDKPSAVTTAEAAGSAAVVASPATGIAGVVGAPTELK